MSNKSSQPSKPKDPGETGGSAGVLRRIETLATPQPNSVNVTGKSLKQRMQPNLSHLGYADFLLGAVASWNAGYIPITGARQMDPQVIIQDDFKALPNGQIQFRFDATNALNHTSYGIPNASIGGSTVGKITSAALSGRVLQLGARLSS